jgi:hypothetical protein
VQVRLKRSELAVAEQASRLRWQLARASGVENKKVDITRSDQDLDLLGICSEIVVSKVLGVDFNASALGIDSGNDIFVDAGESELCIQVKGTFTRKGNLLFTNHEKFAWDAAVLVCKTDSDDRYDIAGCISKEKACQVVERRDLGKGEGYFIPREKLSGIGDLMEFIATRRFA